MQDGKSVDKSRIINQKAWDIARLASITADEMKADDILLLEIGNISTLCDYFVICTAKSSPHIKAVEDDIEEKIRLGLGVKPITRDGDSASKWVVIDYGATIIHILSPEMRKFYSIENVWGDAPKMFEYLPSVKQRISN